MPWELQRRDSIRGVSTSSDRERLQHNAKQDQEGTGWPFAPLLRLISSIDVLGTSGDALSSVRHGCQGYAPFSSYSAAPALLLSTPDERLVLSYRNDTGTLGALESPKGDAYHSYGSS